MKKLLLTIAIMAVPVSAVSATTNGTMTAVRPAAPNSPNVHYPQPVYIENGVPVFANEAPESEKKCQDNYGNKVKCPAKVNSK